MYVLDRSHFTHVFTPQGPGNSSYYIHITSQSPSISAFIHVHVRSLRSALLLPGLHISPCSSFNLFTQLGVRSPRCSFVLVIFHFSVHPSLCSSFLWGRACPISFTSAFVHLGISVFIHPKSCRIIFVTFRTRVAPESSYYAHHVILDRSQSLVTPLHHTTTTAYGDRVQFTTDVITSVVTYFSTSELNHPCVHISLCSFTSIGVISSLWMSISMSMYVFVHLCTYS